MSDSQIINDKAETAITKYEIVKLVQQRRSRSDDDGQESGGQWAGRATSPVKYIRTDGRLRD
jgi:hypothetical protein